jgi:hypothetical protein
MIALLYSGTYEHRVPAVSVRSFKAACGFPEDAEGRSAVRHAPGLTGDRTRRLFNTAVLHEARVCDGHVAVYL